MRFVDCLLAVFVASRVNINRTQLRVRTVSRGGIDTPGGVHIDIHRKRNVGAIYPLLDTQLLLLSLIYRVPPITVKEGTMNYKERATSLNEKKMKNFLCKIDLSHRNTSHESVKTILSVLFVVISDNNQPTFMFQD